MRRSAAGEQRLELGERVERPLRQHAAGRVEHERVRAAGDAEPLPVLGVATSSNSTSETCGSRPASSTAGASAWHRRQPSEVKTARRSAPRADARVEERGQAAVGAARRPLLGDLERGLRADREPQHPDLAREREHRDAERRDGDERERRGRSSATCRSTGRRAGRTAAPRTRRPARAARRPRGRRPRPGAEAAARRAGAASAQRAPEQPAPAAGRPTAASAAASSPAATPAASAISTAATTASGSRASDRSAARLSPGARPSRRRRRAGRPRGRSAGRRGAPARK